MKPSWRSRPPPRWERTDTLLTLALVLSALALYSATLAPGLVSASVDSNELITKSAQGILAHRPGSPVYVWLGWLFARLPFEEVATRVNWMSAVFGSLAVGIFYPLASRHLVRHRLAAVAGAVLFALSFTFWAQAVIAELYTPNMAFLALAVLGLLEWAALPPAEAPGQGRRWLVLAAAAFGLSCGIHLSNLLYLPALLLFMLPGLRLRRAPDSALAPAEQSPARRRQLDLAAGSLAAVAGSLALALPYVWVYFALRDVPYRDGYPPAAPGWPRFYEYTLNAFAELRFAYELHEIPARIGLFLHLLQLNLRWLGLLLMVLGIGRLLWQSPRAAMLLLVLGAANVGFYVSYRVPDIDVFFIPAFWVALLLCACGLDLLAGTIETLSARVLRKSRLVSWPAAMAVAAAALVIAVGQWVVGYPSNNMSADRHFGDFYGNVFEALPEGAYLYYRGSVFGYDMVYYTEVYRVRPDLHVQVGDDPAEPADPPWPAGPVFAGTTSRDKFLPDFINNPRGDNLKWYDLRLAGMFPGLDGIMPDWLKMYRVLADPPADWLLPAGDAGAVPETELNLPVISTLTLAGITAESTAIRGQPWRLVRYWSSTKRDMPVIATVLGDHLAIELHTPLQQQLPDYLRARGMDEDDLPGMLIRDETYLVIPSTIPPGRYPVTISTIDSRLLSLIKDPLPADVLLHQEQLIATLEVIDGAAPDPLDYAGSSAESGQRMSGEWPGK